MVLALCVYQFSLNMAASGDIEPHFQRIQAAFSEDNKNFNLEENLLFSDLIHIYYSLTTGISEDSLSGEKSRAKPYIGRKKGGPYRILATFRRAIDDSQYLIVGIFSLNDEIEIFEETMVILTEKLDPDFLNIAKKNIKNPQIWAEIIESIETTLRYGIYQIERLANLTISQRIALIFKSPERKKTLELLRKGPVSRDVLFNEILKTSDNMNLDMILKPFIELNLVRRDWVKGVKDNKTGIVKGRGEYIFLIRDIALVRKPAENIFIQMHDNNKYGPDYLKQAQSYFQTYDPLEQSKLEVEKLANILLNPDCYDLIDLLKEKSFQRQKMPKIISVFSSPEKIIQELLDQKILTTVKITKDDELLCLYTEIEPIFVFPEYLMEIIQGRAMKKSDAVEEDPFNESITKEIAKKALDFLEASYYETIQLKALK